MFLSRFTAVAGRRWHIDDGDTNAVANILKYGLVVEKLTLTCVSMMETPVTGHFGTGVLPAVLFRPAYLKAEVVHQSSCISSAS